ncbi:alpha/beta fold hydrolase [Mycobacterium sp.]|uniref:alpha/beta fold hydrolase n=1 Tax=Mycobacterium sp. TaxID=1785 RepID=UPI002D082AE3|nr:alpha/beta fold hydrolase [Mycobacterium sp.]HME48504.1 alpha/beta fold hydrolase [Mycobacterium sp.]
MYEVDPANRLTPLLLLHGAGVDSALVSFGTAPVALGQRRRVVAPDLPGYGDTEFAAASFSIPWYGDWVADLVRALRLDRVDLAGLSLGGWITLEVAVSHPDVVRRVIPINPGGVTEKVPFMRTANWIANRPALHKRLYKWSAGMGRRFTRLQLRNAAVENASALTDDLIDAVIVNGSARTPGRRSRPPNDGPSDPDGRLCPGCRGSEPRRWSSPGGTTDWCRWPTPFARADSSGMATPGFWNRAGIGWCATARRSSSTR